MEERAGAVQGEEWAEWLLVVREMAWRVEGEEEGVWNEVVGVGARIEGVVLAPMRRELAPDARVGVAGKGRLSEREGGAGEGVAGEPG